MSTNSCQLWSPSGACRMWSRQSSSFVQGKWQLRCQNNLRGLLETRWWLSSCRREHVFTMTTFTKRSTATKTSHYIVYPDSEEFMLQVCMTASACSSAFAMHAAANLLTKKHQKKHAQCEKNTPTCSSPIHPWCTERTVLFFALFGHFPPPMTTYWGEKERHSLQQAKGLQIRLSFKNLKSEKTFVGCEGTYCQT